MLMRVTACYRTKPIDGMAVKKREMNSALQIAELSFNAIHNFKYAGTVGSKRSQYKCRMFSQNLLVIEWMTQGKAS